VAAVRQERQAVGQQAAKKLQQHDARRDAEGGNQRFPVAFPHIEMMVMMVVMRVAAAMVAVRIIMDMVMVMIGIMIVIVFVFMFMTMIVCMAADDLAFMPTVLVAAVVSGSGTCHKISS
jgi:lipopolysaccharide export LptBFGC system permease protein LptF